MQFYNIEVQGTLPLLQYRYPLDGSTPPKTATEYERAEFYLHRNDKGPFAPANWFTQSFINAGRHHKMPGARGRLLTTADETVITSLMHVQGDEFPIQHNTPWVVHASFIVNAAGSRSACYRPMFPDWRVQFGLAVDDAMDEQLARSIVDTAGARIGVGNWRISRKGSFGAFKVVKWDKVIQ